MPDFIGRQMGNYLLKDILGQGAFATVYLGEHVRLHTYVAIKVLETRLLDENAEQFLAEAHIIAHLNHPHIVRVFDFNVENGTPYLVEDYAPKGTLRRLYPGGTRLPVDLAVNYTRQIADALQYAHDRKVIHRDVKPQNVLLGPHNNILLCDFGIATISESSRLADMQDVAGTAPYMAPEQFRGQPRRASDQYALAIVVYEWLTGSYPFQGSFTEIASQHLFIPPPPLGQRRPGISRSIEEVVQIALSKEPEQRFGSVHAFAHALEQASKESPPPVIFSHVEPAESVPAVDPIGPLRVRNGQEGFESGSQVIEHTLPETSPAQEGQLAAISPHPTEPPVYRRSSKRKWAVPGGIILTLVLIVSLLIAFIPRDPPRLAASPPACQGFSDHFQQKDLGGWTWQDPSNASTYDFDNAAHFFHMYSPGSADEDLNPTPTHNTNAPRILQPISGNFSIETQIDFVQQPGTFQGAALIIWKSQSQFLRLEISAWNNKYYGVNFVFYDMSDPQNDYRELGSKLLATPPTVKLRLQRKGNVFSAEWQQGTGNWSPINKTYTFPSGSLEAGFTLMNSKILNLPLRPAEAYFHYFHFTCLNA